MLTVKIQHGIGTSKYYETGQEIEGWQLVPASESPNQQASVLLFGKHGQCITVFDGDVTVMNELAKTIARYHLDERIAAD